MKSKFKDMIFVKGGKYKPLFLDEEKISPDIADFKKTEGFRLPTEIEWNWFARGGQKSQIN